MLSVGSEPIDKKQTQGILFSLSDHIVSRFKTIPSAKAVPNDSPIYFLAIGSVRSGTKLRISRSFLKVSKVPEYPSGNTLNIQIFFIPT